MAQPVELRFGFPLPRPHTGVALGNGQLGVLVWGGEQLCLTLNRADYWDHRGGEELLPGNDYQRLCAAWDPHDSRALESAFGRAPRPGGWRPSTRLPLGRLEVALAPGCRLVEAVLQPAAGRLRLRVEGACRGELALAVDPDSALLWVDDPAGLLGAVTARPAWDFVADYLRSLEHPEPQRLAAGDHVGWSQTLPADPALAVFAERQPAGLAVAVTRGESPDAALAAARLEVGRVGPGGALLQAAALAWWRGYWLTLPEVHLPEPWMQFFYDYATYKFGAATAPESTHPAGLQGPWVEEYQRTPWSGDYHFNVNIQQIYTLAFHLGKCDHLQPLLDQVARYQPLMRRQAQVLHGLDDGLVLAHAVDDRGLACGGISAGAILDQAVLGWTAHLHWLYWQHTGDREFLRQRAWPLLRGCLRVYQAMLEPRPGGGRGLGLSISAEYAQPLPGGRSQNVGRDASCQLSCARLLASHLQAAAAELGEPAEDWWADLASLAPYTLVGEPGHERIAIWEGQDLDLCHRHHSHLAALYPFDNLPDDPATAAVLDESLDHWIRKGMGQWSEWCMPWAAILQARAGFTEAPRVILNLWREIFVNEGWATAYLPRFRGLTAHRRADLQKPKETTEIMQLDGTMAGATALLELLLHCRRGQIRVFPAVPAAWAEVSFRNLWMPGPFVVSARREGGVTTAVQVTSRRGGRLRLDVPDRPTMQLRQGGQQTEVALPLDRLTAPGELLELL
ncbi:MAG: hypothetical protein IT204_01935 [Fimbriimonadaceae bacterium]|nr:hypothetical protein [Fimbriimonadaceae bacterium]